MCREKDCDCLDEICCSMRTKALFYAYWTLVHYVVLFIWALVMTIKPVRSHSSFYVVIINLAIICILVLSWIFMLFGIYKKNGTLYIIGFILSWLIALFFIYTIVVSFIFTIICVRYYIFHLRKRTMASVNFLF